MKVAVIGTGYVGLTTAVSLAIQGHEVTGVDVDIQKVSFLQKGKSPIYEPGLDRELEIALRKGSLSFTYETAPAVKDAEIIFVCVGTPSKTEGAADLSFLYSVCEELKYLIPLDGNKRAVVIKSTVPMGTTDQIAASYSSRNDIHIISNPEFLREGSALRDSLEPSRIVIGADAEEAIQLMKQLYASVSAPRVITTRANAEMIKYASNAFLATRISFMNELARLCSLIGVDVQTVAQGMGMDSRIGPQFLSAGLGYGGSCFPKDTAALLALAKEKGVSLSILEHVREVNRTQPGWFLEQVRNRLGSLSDQKIALLGLSFKPDTDDIREAPSLHLIPSLLAEGAAVTAYDPIASAHVKKLYPQISVAETPYEALAETSGALLVTEWEECTNLDWSRIKGLMASPNVFDGRNAWPGPTLRNMGFYYTGVARG